MGLNALQYTTQQGDTFDMLALDAYNDEGMAAVIINANPLYAGVLVFDAGVTLTIPIVEATSVQTLPPWKR
ncbi:tail protein X [Hydrogenoanaerobacterium saccharovorans]|uniref:Phage Tail Protein X n=1 Tax=Hydrogenoanaerobacterium saccharovorans TaxID=474960 RepID=A0A1H7YKE6_9FIRM|nr:tail protein X [Hydrogenoanaerobacterium saccharovorans]RPF41916.1 tail protein X [Hydrogenoanaerobacterium saccharovorans]SEM45768.1 Phage Tail Protein X [Hydrogenoanaerobacterium saccharovorans]